MNKKIWIAGVLAATLVTCQVSRQNTSKTETLKTTEASVAAIPAFTENPSPAYLTPEQSIKTFKLPKGYHLELVASEPMIHEPVAVAWDGNARMYVAELNTYMQDVEGTGEHDPTSRVMLLEDTNNDGKMDKSSVFIDKMLLPRMLLCVGNELLVNETDTYDIYAYKDNNKDGVADEKRPVYTPGKKSPGNLEHQRSGLNWNVDNWIYMAVDPVRFRYSGGKLLPDSLPSGSNGQWGLTHDNYGRLYFSSAGGEVPALGFQLNPAYGRMEFADQYKEEFNEVWPIIKTPDVEGGLKRLRPDTTLNHFTASCGQVIFRGDRLPADLQGDLLISEPVGRLIRRAKVINKNGKITLENAYDKSEFIASTDMNFRAVNMYTGPDGCLYIVDMNRGIIQEGNWTGPKSYLRPQIQRLGLDKNIQHGRIYRLVYDGMERGPAPKMLDEPANKLVGYLGHTNGWWRDNAQKELIIRNDRSVAPGLKAIAAGQKNDAIASPSALARLHALWTLEGLNALTPEVVQIALRDSDFEVRKAAVRISESYLKKDDGLLASLTALKTDPSPDVRSQLVFSLAKSKSEKAGTLSNDIVSASPTTEIIARAPRSIEKNDDARKFGMRLGRLDAPDRALVMNGSVIYKSLCATCHGADGKGLVSKTAPQLTGSRRLNRNNTEAAVRILLHGLSGPIDGNTYPTEMPSMKDNDDQWIASVLSYVRHEFTNSPPIRPADVKAIREKTVSRDRAFTLDELSVQ